MRIDTFRGIPRTFDLNSIDIYDEIDKMEQSLRKRGKACLELNEEIRQRHEVIVEFKGRYVVRLSDQATGLIPLRPYNDIKSVKTA